MGLYREFQPVLGRFEVYVEVYRALQRVLISFKEIQEGYSCLQRFTGVNREFRSVSWSFKDSFRKKTKTFFIF